MISKIIHKTIVIVVLALGLGQPLTVRAMGSHPDLLIVNGDTLLLFGDPLQSYFDESHPKPDDMWGIISTAYFEIRSDSLFLRSVRLYFKRDSSVFYPLEKLFGDKATPAGVFAYWINDTLSCVDGHLLFYSYMVHASIFEFEVEFIDIDEEEKVLKMKK